MTIKELMDHVQRLAGPVNPQSALGSTAIAALLFDAMCDAALKTNLFKLRATASINIDATNSFYFPSDMLQLLGVSAMASTTGSYRPLGRITQETADEYAYSGVAGSASAPQYFYSLGIETAAGANYGKDKFAIYPAPLATVASGLRFRYLRFPTHPTAIAALAMTTPVVDFPVTFHLALAYEAAWLQLSAQSARQAKDFSGYHKRYEDQLATLQVNFDEDGMFDSHGGFVGVEFGGVASLAQRRLI